MSDKDDHIRSILITGKALSEIGELPEAIGMLERALCDLPDNPLLLGALGNFCAQMGYWHKAISSYTAAIQHDTEGHTFLHLGIAISYYNLDDLDSAIGEFKYLSSKDPDNPQWHWFLARCYHYMGRYWAAFPEYEILFDCFQREKALNINNMIADLFRENGHNEYITLLNSYQTGMLAIMHNMVGDMYLKNGQVDSAITTLKKSLAVSPNMGETHNWLGKCYERKGLMNEAKSEYQIAKKLGYNQSET